MERRKRFAGASRRLLCLAALLSVVGLLTAQGAASPSVRTLGVVDFYAVTPSGSFTGISPERFAADDLSDLLTHAGGDRVVVIPRRVVRHAEATTGWRSDDVLRFSRLEVLAHAIGADKLVIGWITMSGGPDDSAPAMADVSVVVQLFDARQRRIVAETRQSVATLLFDARTFPAEQGLHLALLPTVPWVITTHVNKSGNRAGEYAAP